MLSDRHYMRGNPVHRAFGPPQSIIKPLIIANVVVFVLTGFGSDPANPLTQALALHPYYIREFQVWRLATYMFVHGGFFHIFFNMWGLYLFGTPVERQLGPNRFLRLYFISGLVGGVAWLALNWSAKMPYSVMMREGMGIVPVHRDVQGTAAAVASDPRVVDVLAVYGYVIGASGGIFGVMMACAMAFPNVQIMLLFPPIPMRIRTFVFVYGAIEVMSALRNAREHHGGIAHLAHLGGLLGAFFYMKRLGFRNPFDFFRRSYRNITRGWRRRRIHVVGPRPPDDAMPSDWEAQTDRILDKIGTHGIQSLTPEERRVLEMARDRFRQRGGR